MAGYNFKNFFKDKKVHNSEYVSNAHFIIKRSLLTKKQNEFIDTFESNEQLAKNMVNILLDTIKRESDMELEQYIPEFININFVSSSGEKYNIVFNSNEIAENLQKQGGFIEGVRPGIQTEKYLSQTMNRLILFGSLVLGTIAVLPFLAEYVLYQVAGVQNANLAVGGTGILIVVSVALEALRQINSRALMVTYDDYK